MGLRKPVPFSEEHGIQEGVGKKSTQNVHLVQKVTGAAIIFPNPGPTDRGANSLYHGETQSWHIPQTSNRSSSSQFKFMYFHKFETNGTKLF